KHVDIRADIYSLGCTLYHLLAGHPPFAGGSPATKISAHLFQQPRNLVELRDEVPPVLTAVLQRMMAKEPAQRYQTPAEVAQALEAFVRPAGTFLEGPLPLSARPGVETFREHLPPQAATHQELRSIASTGTRTGSEAGPATILERPEPQGKPGRGRSPAL